MINEAQSLLPGILVALRKVLIKLQSLTSRNKFEALCIYELFISLKLDNPKEYTLLSSVSSTTRYQLRVLYSLNVQCVSGH